MAALIIRQHHTAAFCRKLLLQSKTAACIPTVSAIANFYVKSPKGEYEEMLKIRSSLSERFKVGSGMLKGEFMKFKDEVKERFACDNLWSPEHGDYEVLWKFDDKDVVLDWVVSTDADCQAGTSSAELKYSQNKTAIFAGNLVTEPPKDGLVKYAGYCNMHSPFRRISFQRKRSYDWSHFNHLVMRVRGDGRPYGINLNLNRYYDVHWNDQYHYPLYTRGGPYWQIAKIPFSKFLLSSKGRVQVMMDSVPLDEIGCFGITLADGSPGPFRLELDYIGLIYDESHSEKFAYEAYETEFWRLS